MQAVTFRMSAAAMDAAGWLEGQASFGRKEKNINEIVSAAKCAFQKIGKGGHFTFRCGDREAAFIEDHLRAQGEVLVMSSEPLSRMRGRVLNKAADVVRKAIEEASDGGQSIRAAAFIP